MVDPLSIAIGAAGTLVILLAMSGLYLAGFVAARRPSSIVNMDEVENYVTFREAVEDRRTGPDGST